VLPRTTRPTLPVARGAGELRKEPNRRYPWSTSRRYWTSPRSRRSTAAWCTTSVPEFITVGSATPTRTLTTATAPLELSPVRRDDGQASDTPAIFCADRDGDHPFIERVPVDRRTGARRRLASGLSPSMRCTPSRAVSSVHPATPAVVVGTTGARLRGGFRQSGKRLACASTSAERNESPAFWRNPAVQPARPSAAPGLLRIPLIDGERHAGMQLEALRAGSVRVRAARTESGPSTEP